MRILQRHYFNQELSQQHDKSRHIVCNFLKLFEIVMAYATDCNMIHARDYACEANGFEDVSVNTSACHVSNAISHDLS